MIKGHPSWVFRKSGWLISQQPGKRLGFYTREFLNTFLKQTATMVSVRNRLMNKLSPKMKKLMSYLFISLACVLAAYIVCSSIVKIPGPALLFLILGCMLLFSFFLTPRGVKILADEEKSKILLIVIGIAFCAGNLNCFSNPLAGGLLFLKAVVGLSVMIGFIKMMRWLTE